MLECGSMSANVYPPPLLVFQLMIGLEMKVGICLPLLVHVLVRFIFFYFSCLWFLLKELVFLDRVLIFWDHLSHNAGPLSPVISQLCSWKDYYEWRKIPLASPVALLLHWVTHLLLTLFNADFASLIRVFLFIDSLSFFVFSATYNISCNPIHWDRELDSPNK